MSDSFTDREWLERELKNKSIGKIAKELKTTKSTIWWWIRKHKINIWKEKPKYMDEKWLRHEYLDLKKTTQIIAKELNAVPTTISNWLHKFNIPIRPKTEMRIKLDEKLRDREWLKKQFADKSKPLYKIAEECGICKTTLMKLAKKYGIESRDWIFRPPVVKHTDKIIDETNKQIEEWLYKEYYGTWKTTGN